MLTVILSMRWIAMFLSAGGSFLLHPAGEEWPLSLLCRLCPGDHCQGLKVMAQKQAQSKCQVRQ